MKARTHRLLAAICILLLSIALCACNAPQPTAQTDQPAISKKTPRPTFTPVGAQSQDTPTQPPVATEAAEATEEAAEPPAEPTATTAGESSSGEEPTAAPPPTPVPTDPPAPKSLTMASPEYGMQVFMWWRPEVASRDLQMVKAAGFSWVKVNFGWREIEGAGKGQFDWSRTDKIMEMITNDGMDAIIRVDHQPEWVGGGFPVNGPPNNLTDLGDFLSAMATRYKGQIRAYQVWNEPNLAREWGDQVPDPARYVEMMGVAYAAIKAADPNAMVVSAGLSPTGTWSDEARPDDWYLASMYEVMGGNSDGYFDVLGAHAPGFLYAPETDPSVAASDSHGQRAFCFRRVEDLRDVMVKYGDADKQVAILEFGWTSDSRPDSPYAWHSVSEEVKADYLVRAYQYAHDNWSPWIGLMSLIYVCDPDWTTEHEQYYWAINDPSYPEFKPRPAYTALQNMAK